jgi:hypothetical protein
VPHSPLDVAQPLQPSFEEVGAVTLVQADATKEATTRARIMRGRRFI